MRRREEKKMNGKFHGKNREVFSQNSITNY